MKTEILNDPKKEILIILKSYGEGCYLISDF